MTLNVVKMRNSSQKTRRVTAKLKHSIMFRVPGSICIDNLKRRKTVEPKFTAHDVNEGRWCTSGDSSSLWVHTENVFLACQSLQIKVLPAPNGQGHSNALIIVHSNVFIIAEFSMEQVRQKCWNKFPSWRRFEPVNSWLTVQRDAQ